MHVHMHGCVDGVEEPNDEIQENRDVSCHGFLKKSNDTIKVEWYSMCKPLLGFYSIYKISLTAASRKFAVERTSSGIM
jgi:hypothetical protein